MDEIIQALKGFWPLLLLLAFFYFGMYRPQKKQQDKRNKFWEALKKGDYVITAGGIFGLVKKISGNIVSVQVAPGTIIQVDKRALQAPPQDVNNNKKSSAYEEDDDYEDEELDADTIEKNDKA